MLSLREIALCRKNAIETSSAFQGTGMGSVEKGARYYFIGGLSVRCFASAGRDVRKFTRVLYPCAALRGTLPSLTTLRQLQWPVHSAYRLISPPISYTSN